MILRLLPTAAFLLALSLAHEMGRSQEAAPGETKPEAPPAAAAKEPVPDAGGEGVRARPPTDGDARGSPAAAGPTRPTPPPVFPLQSDNFRDVVDDQSIPTDRPDDLDLVMSIEFDAARDILAALKNTSPEELHRHVDPQATYVNLMRAAEKYRGHVAHLEGILRRVDEFALTPDKAGMAQKADEPGATKLWHCYLSNASGQILNVFCLEPPSGAAKLQTGVEAEGIFLKRVLYANRMAPVDDKPRGTWGPAIFAVRLVSSPGLGSSGFDVAAVMNHPLGVGIFAFILLCCVGYFIYRSKTRPLDTHHFGRNRREHLKPTFPRKDGK